MLPGPQPFRIYGFIPDGGPGPDDQPAIPLNIAPAWREEILRAARDLILTATGPREGQHSLLQPASFDAAIRTYRPADKFPGNITPMDRKMYACRVAHRLMNAISGRRLAVPGSYRSNQDTDVRADGLYRAWKELSSTPATPVVRASSAAAGPSRAASTQSVRSAQPLPVGTNVGPALWRAYHAALFSLNVLAGEPVLGRESKFPPETFDDAIRPRYNVTSQRRAESGVMAALEHLDAAGIRYPKPSGSFSSREQVAVRARSVLEIVNSIAAQHGIDPYSGVAARSAASPHPERTAGQEQVERQRAEIEQRSHQETEDRLRREMELAQARAEAERLRCESEAALQRAREAEERLEREEAARREAEQRLEQLARKPNGDRAEPPEGPCPPPVEHPAWAADLADPGARSVFLHLETHGSVTEAEIIAFLGSPRAYRRFSLDFEQHVRSVPFRVRIEPAADGKRYVKEGEV
jgi:hypothetical protein